MQRACTWLVGGLLWVRVGVDLVADIPVGMTSVGRATSMTCLALMTALAVGLTFREPRHRRFDRGLSVGLVAFALGGALALGAALDLSSALRYLALAVGPWLFFVVGRGAGPRAVDV